MKFLLVLGLIVLAGIVIVVAPACSSSKTGSTSIWAMPSNNTTPSQATLEALLMAELARLGVDPAKAAAAAPQGYFNKPFDLSPRVIDPDGLGSGAPTAVVLKWAERCVGDYNQDGLVGVSDLTP
ncbi:hypothetical protein JW859_00890, partial [bacterium]|nr:hypothetical protein [bacterium]